MRNVVPSLTLVLAVASASAQTPSFTLIDPLPGLRFSNSSGISADGGAIAGYSADGNGSNVSFRWTASNRQDFGSGPVPPPNRPGGISGDGQYVVGQTLSSTW